MLEKILQKECHKRSLLLENFSYLRSEIQGSVNGYRIIPRTEIGKAVLFLHGFGNDSLFPQIPFLLRLAQEGLNVFTVDLDGHGVKSTTRIVPEVLLSSVRDAVSFVRKRSGDQELHLIGHSLGSLLSLHACVKWDLKLNSLTLISLPIDIRFTPKVLISEAVLSIASASFFRSLLFYKANFLPALGPLGRSRFPIRYTKKQEEGARDLFRFVLGLQKEPVSSPLRTLYCYGTRDQISPLQKHRLILNASDELFVLRGETHLNTISSPLIAKKVCEWVNIRN